MKHKKSSFILAGTNSGCGKTTLTIGLMGLLKSLGKTISPFKTGPDYIDPLFHSKVLGVNSYNLDSYLLSEPTLKYLYQKHSKNTEISIVEGVMGMYDGMGNRAVGSTHELSNILDLPVVLVVNCKGLYQSVAAIVKGFADFSPTANIKGVILNHVQSEGSYRFLKQIIEKENQVTCIGYLPEDKTLTLESRHLGLVQAQEVEDLDAKIDQLVSVLKQTIDVDTLLEITQVEEPAMPNFALPELDLSDLNIAVASDKAFSFYYQDNLELLKELGARLHFFSPLSDTALPSPCNCLYMGGGYPEVFAAELSNNRLMLDAIHTAANKGLPIYAECGGLMYLCQNIINLDGTQSKFAGVFNASVQMTERLQRFGYAKLSYKNTETKCHEFHRSTIVADDKRNYSLHYQLRKPERNKQWQCGFKTNNTLGAYAHIHFYSDFNFFKQIVQLWKKKTI